VTGRRLALAATAAALGLPAAGALALPLAGATAAARARAPRPCALLTPKLAREIAPGVKTPPEADDVFTCHYSDGKPPSESRWSVTFDIPFRPAGRSAYDSFRRRGVLRCGRSDCGADKAFYTSATNETAVTGPSVTIFAGWLKGRTFGTLSIVTPEDRAPTAAQLERLLRTLLRSIR
jgi:hypothetical protein